MTSALRRVTLTLVAYAVGAWVVLGAASWVRRELVLPEMFEELLRGAVWVGAVLAGLLAWHYPAIAAAGDAEPSRDPE